MCVPPRTHSVADGHVDPVVEPGLARRRDAVDPSGTVIAGPAQDARDAVERHALGYDAGLIAFGLSRLVLAWLLLAGNLVPGCSPGAWR
jgi:hypothetical protein